MTSKWIITLCIIQSLFLTVTVAKPSITIGGSSSPKQTYELNDNVTITCTISTSYNSISSYYIQRAGRNYEYLGNSHIGSITKTITCDDNSYFRCYGRFNSTYMYSTYIYVTVECPPTWAESVKEPVFYSSDKTDKYFDLSIIGQPQPTYSVQKYTASGLQDLSINVDIWSYSNKVRLYFRTYSVESHGVYSIEANNSIGMFSTNVTLRGLTLPPKNVKAWSTTPNSVHVEWTAGELFEAKTQYKLYYKTQDGKWSSYINVYSIGVTVNYVFNTFERNTTYYFLVTAYNSQFGTSVYSNFAQATTLRNPTDPPQTKPPLVLGSTPIIVKSTPKTDVATDVNLVSTPKTDVVTDVNLVSTPKTDCAANKEVSLVPEQDDLTFGTGIGIGLGIGLMLVIIAIMGTVIFFKRSPSKQDKIPMAPPISRPTEETEGDRIYLSVEDNSPYAQLSHRNTGVGYDNQASEARP